MRRLRRVKIIATLGPATVEKAVIAGLVRAGADVFRINMSHTDHAALAAYVLARQLAFRLYLPYRPLQHVVPYMWIGRSGALQLTPPDGVRLPGLCDVDD